MALEIMPDAIEGLYPKPNDSTVSIMFRYSGEYIPKGPISELLLAFENSTNDEIRSIR